MEKRKDYPNLIVKEQKQDVAHIKKLQGVYRIAFTDGCYYVGSSINLNSRASNYMYRRQLKYASGGLKRFIQIKGVFGVIEYAPYLSKLDLLLLEREEIIKDGKKSINKNCPVCNRRLNVCACSYNHKNATKSW
jgi:hypothetical protein